MFLTKAGMEIGVASTKAFTTQLVALLMLTASRWVGAARMSEQKQQDVLAALRGLPDYVQRPWCWTTPSSVCPRPLSPNTTPCFGRESITRSRWRGAEAEGDFPTRRRIRRANSKTRPPGAGG